MLLSKPYFKKSTKSSRII